MSDNTHLEHIRHTLAHLLASATLQLYPEAKLTLGPAVDNGFYYDIDFGDEKISDQVLKKIEKYMKKSLSHWKAFDHMEVSAEEAEKIFAGNQYKLELIKEIAERGEKITLYYVGAENSMPSKDELIEAGSSKLKTGFLDLCRGGHVEHPSQEISADMFQLDRIAGAYWRGDEKNPMLTRIYGLAFENKEQLDAYLEQREEAKKRDHRKIGKELDLFTFSDLVGAGLPLWTPKGTMIRDLIIEKIQNIQKDFGYQKVTIPHITKKTCTKHQVTGQSSEMNSLK
jgi:threonyl-tRNA synthetase